MISVTPHIAFDDKKCREAMEFYKSCLGGTLTFMTVGETPADVKEGMKKWMPGVAIDDAKIMHSSLEDKAGKLLLTAADMMDPKTFKPGDTFTVTIVADTEKETRDIMKKLSAGGKVTMDLEPMFWGGLFGSWTDKFGVDWMINCDIKKK